MNHHIFRISRACLWSASLLSILGLAVADVGAKPVDAVARELMAAHGDAVVTLIVVTEVTLTVTDRPSRSEELTIEVPGTVVNRRGWIAASKYKMQPRVPTSERNGIEVKFTYETKEVRIVWGNGEESSAVIVFNDEDLDVSIVRPDEERDDAVAVDFGKAVAHAEPQLLDHLMVFARQDESIDRLLRVETGRIAAVIDRPRPMFVGDISEPGAPAFHASGGLIGLCTLKVTEGQEPVPVIRPGADVVEVLQSALASAGVSADEPEPAAVQTANEADIAIVGRNLLEKFQDSVVSLSTIIERNKRTQEVWSVGVVMGADGLVAVSRTGLARTDINEVKIVLGDGTELKAKMVLEDLDLDLAFIQPDAQDVKDQGIEFPVSPFVAEASPVELKFADPVIMLTRESPAFFRQPKLVVTHVDSVVENPRRYYRTLEKQAGAPGFNAKGELVGIYARRVTGEETRHRMVLPAAHVVEAAERARKAALESPQPEDTAPKEQETEETTPDQ